MDKQPDKDLLQVFDRNLIHDLIHDQIHFIIQNNFYFYILNYAPGHNFSKKKDSFGKRGNFMAFRFLMLAPSV